jgi:tetratricopeptide (TPR) repeat protein
LKVAEEFKEHEKAAKAQFQVGNIYFYKLYDYGKGWPEYNKVISEFSDSYEADEADRILKETQQTLNTIHQYIEDIKKYTSKTALKYEESGRHVSQSEKYGVFADRVAQNYTNIAKGWIDLKNYPNAIAAYQELAKELSMEKFEAAEARYQVARLYQEDGQYQKAIEAYNRLFKESPESTRRNDATYRQAVCYQAIGNFEKAYEGFKTYLGFSQENVEKELFREAKQKVRQMEMDQDNDGYMLYQEANANTSDQDPNQHP